MFFFKTFSSSPQPHFNSVDGLINGSQNEPIPVSNKYFTAILDTTEGNLGMLVNEKISVSQHGLYFDTKLSQRSD